MDASTLVAVLALVPFHLLAGMLFYGPLFGGLFVQLAFGSRERFEAFDRHGTSLQGTFRRSLIAAVAGAVVLNAALATLMGPGFLHVRDASEAAVVGLWASLVLLGSALAHGLIQGKATGLVLLDQAYNAVVLPAAAVALHVLRAYL